MLRGRYPLADGWAIEGPDVQLKTYRPDFLVSRINRHGKIEKVVVEVKDECVIDDKPVRQVLGYARNGA